MRPAVKKDGTEHYEFIFEHTDDLLVISTTPHDILTHLDQHYVLKPESIGKPTQYLGSETGDYRLEDNPTMVRWYASPDNYVKEAVRNLNNWISERGRLLKVKVQRILPSRYRPELDATPYCDEEESDYYQQQIGVLRWAIELGRIDITAATSMLASYTAAPRQGNISALFLPCAVTIDPNLFSTIAISLLMTKKKFGVADHAGDMVKRLSRTGLLIYLNRSAIFWYSKKQNSVETSTFGSEFIALKTGMEMIKGLRYKLTYH
jgi:hypothetical protein